MDRHKSNLVIIIDDVRFVMVDKHRMRPAKNTTIQFDQTKMKMKNERFEKNLVAKVHK